MNHLNKALFAALTIAALCRAAPTVSPDGMVTFSYVAPTATAVSVGGDWGGGRVPMVKDERGVWTVDVPLKPQIYAYTFEVDGRRTVDPTNPQLKLGRVVVASSVEVPGTPPKPWELRNVPHGDVVSISYDSPAAGDQRRITVWTPPGYHPNQEAKLPILYLLHGNGEVDSSWVQYGRANLIADSLLADGRMEPMIIVMPKGHAYARGQIEVDGVRPESVFAEDLLETIMPLVEKRFRVQTNQSSRAIMGLSMGGGQAFRIGLSHLDLFSHVGVLSASGRDPELLAKLAADPDSANAKLQLLWIACGRLDRGFERVETMVNDLTAAGIEHTFKATAGSHNWINWREYLVETLPLLFK